MANSLKAKLSKLRYDGHITDAEYQTFIKKLDGYEQEIRAKVIDEFAENLKRKILEEIYDVSDRQKNYEVGSDMSMTCSHIMGTLRDVRHRIIDEISEQMKGGAV